MESFPPNSHVSKADETKPKVEKVITGEVQMQKKTLGRKFRDIFMGENAESVWQYVAFDVVVPAVKDMLSDALSQGVDRVLFGDSRGPSRTGGRSSGYSTGFTNYSRYSGSRTSGRSAEPAREVSRRGRANHDFREIVLDTRAECESIIDQMFEMIKKYGQVSVGDLYGMLGVTASFPDERYGWTEMQGARAERVRNGYLLNIPAPHPID